MCGGAADKLLREEKEIVREVKSLFGQTNDPVSNIKKLMDEKKALEKELEKVQMANSGALLDDILSKTENLDGIEISKGEIPGADVATLKQLGYDALQKVNKDRIIVLGSKDEENGKVFLMVAVTEDLISGRNLKAGALVGKLGRLVGGGGGGQPNLATAGGKNPEKLSEALSSVKEIVKESL